MPQFGAVQPNGDKVFFIGQCIPQGIEGILFTQMAEEGQYQVTGNAQLFFAVSQCPADALNDRTHRNAPFRMGLGVKEGFGMYHTVCLTAK